MAAVVPIVPGIALKRILYATDFSDASRAAVPLLATVARRYGAHVIAAHICSPVVYPLVAADVIEVLDRRQEHEAEKTLEKLLQSAVLQGIPCEAIVRCGSPTQELGKIVRQQRIDLAVASTHGCTGWKRCVLGSVTEELLRNLSCPVLSIGPHVLQAAGVPQKISSILYPTDFSQDSLAVFPYLTSLAHEYRSKLTVLHVLTPEAARRPDVEKVAEQLRTQMERNLGAEISPRCAVEFVIETGDVPQQVLAWAQRIKADLIGLGVRCATDIAIQFRETAAYRILCDAECPLLTYHTCDRQ